MSVDGKNLSERKEVPTSIDLTSIDLLKPVDIKKLQDYAKARAVDMIKNMQATPVAEKNKILNSFLEEFWLAIPEKIKLELNLYGGETNEIKKAVEEKIRSFLFGNKSITESEGGVKRDLTLAEMQDIENLLAEILFEIYAAEAHRLSCKTSSLHGSTVLTDSNFDPLVHSPHAGAIAGQKVLTNFLYGATAGTSTYGMLAVGGVAADQFSKAFEGTMPMSAQMGVKWGVSALLAWANSHMVFKIKTGILNRAVSHNIGFLKALFSHGPISKEASKFKEKKGFIGKSMIAASIVGAFIFVSGKTFVSLWDGVTNGAALANVGFGQADNMRQLTDGPFKEIKDRLEKTLKDVETLPSKYQESTKRAALEERDRENSEDPVSGNTGVNRVWWSSDVMSFENAASLNKLANQAMNGDRLAQNLLMLLKNSGLVGSIIKKADFDNTGKFIFEAGTRGDGSIDQEIFNIAIAHVNILKSDLAKIQGLMDKTDITGDPKEIEKYVNEQIVDYMNGKSREFKENIEKAIRDHYDKYDTLKIDRASAIESDSRYDKADRTKLEKLQMEVLNWDTSKIKVTGMEYRDPIKMVAEAKKGDAPLTAWLIIISFFVAGLLLSWTDMFFIKGLRLANSADKEEIEKKLIYFKTFYKQIPLALQRYLNEGPFSKLYKSTDVCLPIIQKALEARVDALIKEKSKEISLWNPIKALKNKNFKSGYLPKFKEKMTHTNIAREHNERVRGLQEFLNNRKNMQDLLKEIMPGLMNLDIKEIGDKPENLLDRITTVNNDQLKESVDSEYRAMEEIGNEIAKTGNAIKPLEPKDFDKVDFYKNREIINGLSLKFAELPACVPSNKKMHEHTKNIIEVYTVRAELTELAWVMHNIKPGSISTLLEVERVKENEFDPLSKKYIEICRQSFYSENQEHSARGLTLIDIKEAEFKERKELGDIDAQVKNIRASLLKGGEANVLNLGTMLEKTDVETARETLTADKEILLKIDSQLKIREVTEENYVVLNGIRSKIKEKLDDFSESFNLLKGKEQDIHNAEIARQTRERKERAQSREAQIEAERTKLLNWYNSRNIHKESGQRDEDTLEYFVEDALIIHIDHSDEDFYTKNLGNIEKALKQKLVFMDPSAPYNRVFKAEVTLAYGKVFSALVEDWELLNKEVADSSASKEKVELVVMKSLSEGIDEKSWCSISSAIENPSVISGDGEKRQLFFIKNILNIDPVPSDRDDRNKILGKRSLQVYKTLEILRRKVYFNAELKARVAEIHALFVKEVENLYGGKFISSKAVQSLLQEK